MAMPGQVTSLPVPADTVELSPMGAVKDDARHHFIAFGNLIGDRQSEVWKCFAGGLHAGAQLAGR